MEHKKSANEFEALVDDEGKILVPSELLGEFSRKRIHVRISSRENDAGLKENNVTEDELDRISSLQLESREQVVKFLLSEGALKGSSFDRRVRGTY